MGEAAGLLGAGTRRACLEKLAILGTEGPEDDPTEACTSSSIGAEAGKTEARTSSSHKVTTVARMRSFPNWALLQRFVGLYDEMFKHVQ